jgi:hypothetical protein
MSMMPGTLWVKVQNVVHPHRDETVADIYIAEYNGLN